MKRILLVAAAGLAIVALAGALILPRWLDPEAHRDRLQRMLAEATGRSVTIGPMRLRLFPAAGITAEGFTLGEDPAFGSEPFLKADRLEARVALFPLFRSKLKVLSFDIARPAAHLQRNAAGRWNLTSLTEPTGGEAAPEKRAPPTEGGLTVQIDRLRLLDGTLDVADAAIVPGTVHRIEGREIQLTLSDLSTTSPIGIELKLGLSGAGKATLDGRLGPPPAAAGGGWPIEGRVVISDFVGGAIAPYLATYTGLRLAGGSFDLDATVGGKIPTGIDLQGEVALDGLEIVPLGGPPGEPKRFDGAVSVDGSLTPKETRIRSAKVRLGQAAVTLSGALTDLAGKPTADLRAVASKVPLRDIAPILSLFGPLLPAGIAMKGEITIDATARGPLDDPKQLAIGGMATVSGLELSDPSLKAPIREIAATLAFQGDRAEITGLSASLGRSRLEGSCTISRFARPVLDVNLLAPLLDVDEILSFLPASEVTAAPRPAAPAPPASGAPSSILGEVTIRGALAASESKVMNVRLTSARARLDLSEGAVRLHDLSAKLYGGSLSGRLEAGLLETGPPFALAAQLRGVDFNGLASDFSKDLAGVLHGTLETSLDVKGRGLDTPGIRQNLTGRSTVALRNGKLVSFAFLEQLAAALEAAGGRGIGREDTPFDSLTGTFDIRGGRASTQDLRLDSADLDLDGKGSVGLDQTIALDVGARFSAPVSAGMVAKTAALANLTNAKGELALALKVGGTLQQPSITVDSKMLKRAAEESLKRKGADALRRLLDKKQR